MENLNAEEIKRLLAEYEVVCDNCACNDGDEIGKKIMLNALALINKQETEYNELYELLQTYKADSEAYRSYSKTLEKENETLKTLLNESYDTQNSLTEENKKLTINMNAFGLTAKRLTEENERLRADTIDEFVKMVKEKMREVATGKRTSLIGTGWIDEIARELKGE